MGMAGALRFAALMKLPHFQFELFVFPQKIPLLGDDELLTGGPVLSERLVIGIEGLEERSDQPPDKDARWIQPA